MQIQLIFEEETVAGCLAAAKIQGMTFNEYVEWRLNVDLDAAAEQTQSAGPQDQPVEEIAKALYNAALNEPAEDSSIDDHFTEGRPYLVETLYKRLGAATPWNLRDRGNRIMIGKAFKRLVDTSQAIETEEGRKVIVKYFQKTAQNQALYKTVVW
jgi:hypothetical protein